MAITEWAYIQGKAKWARLQKPDEWQKWKITVYPTPESLEKIRELQAEGVKNRLRKDEDGYNVTFNRPVDKLTRTGKRIGFEPPLVIGADNKVWEAPPLIGNGSDVTVKLEVYSHGVPGTTQKAKAARLLSVKIDNLVPYDQIKDMEPSEARAAKGLDVQPEQLF